MGIEQIEIGNKNPKEYQSGILTRNEAINLIEEIVGTTKIKNQVVGRVEKVYAYEKELPIQTSNDGINRKVWSYLSRIDVVLNHNKKKLQGIGPLCSHFNCLPLVDEEVIIVDHEGQLYYSFPLNRFMNVNQNRVGKITGEKSVFEPTTYYARPIAIKPGDTTMQGRFGNYISLTSEPESNGYPAFPKIVIGNNMDRDLIQVEHKNYDKKFPHFHNPNSIGSCIEMTSNPKPSTLIPAALEKDMVPLHDSAGDVITITSDRIIMNAKEGDISLHSSDNINLTSIDSINIVGLNKVHIGRSFSAQAIAKGTAVKNVLGTMIKAIEAFCKTMSEEADPEIEFVQHGEMGPAVKILASTMESLRQQYIEGDKLLSKKVFAE